MSEEGKKVEHRKSLTVESCEVDSSHTMYGGRLTLTSVTDGCVSVADVVET